METSDIAAMGYASQTLAYAILSTIFLARRNTGLFSRHLGIATAATSVSGGVLTLLSLDFIPIGVVHTDANDFLWIRNRR